MPEPAAARLEWTPAAFEPLPWLAGPHRMTVAATYWRRRFPRLPPAEDRLVEAEPETRLLTRWHWQRERRERPLLVLVHGLEGSSESGYMLGTAERAWQAGFSVARMNQRNCGGTDDLTPTLYHSGLSADVARVVREAIEREGVREIFAAGFSLGGNLVMKMAGEMGARAPAALRAVAAVSPALDLAACAEALERPRNWIYERFFLRQLKRRLRVKARLFPGRYRTQGLGSIRTIREFDDRITAPHSGFRDAADYYERASALRVLPAVAVPALLIAAQDDPMVPYESLARPLGRAQPYIRLVGPRRGGHCGFLARRNAGERFWAEAAIVEFCRRQSRLAGTEAMDSAGNAAEGGGRRSGSGAH